MNDVTGPGNKPYMFESDGPDALKIDYENAANQVEYVDIPLHMFRCNPVSRLCKNRRFG
ncbi:MAG: hypothetical protein PVG45_10480 [Gammaproteobacteria bacterium]|jgi:hypothetical protein